jgi:thioredoxin-related protein
MNHWQLVLSVLLVSSAFGLFLHFTRGKLTKKYSNEISFDQLRVGHELGKKATILQFKTEYCSICPGVKRQINELIKNDKGISFYEIDAVERIELAKKLHVKSSPTVLFFNEVRFRGRQNYWCSKKRPITKYSRKNHNYKNGENKCKLMPEVLDLVLL